MYSRIGNFFYISLLITAVCLVSLIGCLAKEVPLTDSEYSFEVAYSEKICPGDSVYISITYNGYHNQMVPENAELVLYRIDPAEDDSSTMTRLDSTLMYAVRQNPPVLFAQLPTNTWLSPGAYAIEVTYSDHSDESQRFTLPVTCLEKEFVSETLYLDAKNTAIKTDNSKQRAAQIDRLNEVLFTTDYTAIYYDGSFIEPCESRRYTSFFGDRRVYQYNTGSKSTSLHYGVDYGVPVGTPVWACGAGKVVLAEYRNSTGWSVVIEHLPGLYSLYYHMDSFNVEEGQMVRKGEEIGRSGCTGLATGPHLHWELRLFGEAINPHFLVEHQLF